MTDSIAKLESTQQGLRGGGGPKTTWYRDLGKEMWAVVYCSGMARFPRSTQLIDTGSGYSLDG